MQARRTRPRMRPRTGMPRRWRSSRRRPDSTPRCTRRGATWATRNASSHDKALTLKPGYADALEYRGEAYLALNRIPDAQRAYLDLYSGDRALAGKLLTAMKSWVADQRANAAGSNGANLDNLD